MDTYDELDTLPLLRGELTRCQNNIKVLRNSMFFAKSRSMQNRKSEQIAEAQRYEAQLQRRIARRERAERFTQP